MLPVLAGAALQRVQNASPKLSAWGGLGVPVAGPVDGRCLIDVLAASATERWGPRHALDLGVRVGLVLVDGMPSWRQGFAHLTPYGHLLVSAGLTALLRSDRAPHTVFFHPDQAVAVGWWTHGRSPTDESVRLLRVAPPSGPALG